MDEKTIENAIEKVDEILKPEKFNLVDAIKGRSYPEDSIRVYLDEEAAYLLHQTENELSGLSKSQDQDAEGFRELLDDKQRQADEYRERLLATSLKFTLRGRDRVVYDRIQAQSEKDHPDDDRARALAENCGVMAASILSVENAEGAVDEHEFTAEEVESLYEIMPRNEWLRLLELLYSLTFANSYFDQAVNAGFLSRR